MDLKFNDGVEFNTAGHLRIEMRPDGYYVVGEGMMIPAIDLDDAVETLVEFKVEELEKENEEIAQAKQKKSMCLQMLIKYLTCFNSDDIEFNKSFHGDECYSTIQLGDRTLAVDYEHDQVMDFETGEILYPV